MDLPISLEIGATLTAIVAAPAAYVGLLQYKKAEAWRRAEFTGQVLSELTKNEELAFACKSLDWGVGPLVVPSKYEKLFGSKITVIDHNWDNVDAAMEPVLRADVLNDPKKLIYRYTLDALLEYFERVHNYVRLDVIKIEDISTLGYYAALLNKAPYYNGPKEKSKVIGDFIEKAYPGLSGFLCILEISSRRQ